jgi:autotransporter-associated beta strand protein
VSRRPTNCTARCLLLLTRLEDRTAPAALVTWDGGGADNNWTTPANWVGDIAPQVGQDLLFPAAAAQLTNVNDFPAGTTFCSIGITGAGYQISGNAVSVNAGVTADIAAGSTSTLSLAIGGIGGLIKAGTGTLMLAGANTYAGVTAAAAGILEVHSDTALGAIGAGNETTVADGATLQFLGYELNTYQTRTLMASA